MKTIMNILFCLIAILVTYGAYAEEATAKVAPHGTTKIVANAGQFPVEIDIKTHEMDIGKPSDGRPAVIESSCTYSRYPCSVVDRLGITVSGTALSIPRSVFCDLSDLGRAILKAEKEGWVLTLYGGDASESYIAKVEFDTTGVKRRTRSSALQPNKVVQETRYYKLSIGD